MTDGQWLFILFALLYLAECLRLAPAGAWLLMTVGSEGTLRRVFAPLDFAGRRILVLPVLPPQPVHAVMQPWQLLPCASGLEVLNDGGRPEALIPWAEVKPVAVNRVLNVGRGQRVLFHHADLAAAMAERVRKWCALSEEARGQDFEKHARATLDVQNVTAHMAESTKLTRRLRHVSLGIFLLCFGVIPVVYRWFGDSREVLAAAGVLALLMWVQTVLFWRAAGDLPKGRVPYRFWKTLPMFFLPQFGLRASDHLMESRWMEAHPLSAWSALTEAERLKLSRYFWKAACHLSAASADLQQRLLRAFWKQQAFDEAKLEEVPERQPGSAAYCPRCSAQFRDAAMLCQDCGGVPLKPF
ncbi:MAG: hypothetical protein V4662_16570 [Verrucomicrobiota bacterium]